MKRAPHSPQYAGTKCVSAVDWLGNRFHLGEQVMYCIGAGRGQVMAIGEVLKIEVTQEPRSIHVEADADDPDARPEPMRDGRFYRAMDTYRTGRVTREEIAVQVRTLKTSGRWDNTERGKPAWVNAMNITAWPPVGKP